MHASLRRLRRAAGACTAASCLTLTGCLAGAELAILGAAAKAAEPATAAFSSGGVATAFDADFDLVADAAATVLLGLGFDVAIETDEPNKLVLDANGITADVDVAILRRTPGLTELRLDVGLTGSDAVAGEVGKEIFQLVEHGDPAAFADASALPPRRPPPPDHAPPRPRPNRASVDRLR